MTDKKIIAPYGKWESLITTEDATAGSKNLSSPRVCPHTQRAFFLESKANGSNSIVEVLADGGLKCVLPEPHGCDTAIYEYGGLPYAILPPSTGGEEVGRDKEGVRIIFSDGKHNSCNVLNVDSGEVRTLVRSETLRYADFDPHPKVSNGSPWVLAVEEDHAKPAPDEVRNYVVAINIETGDVVRLRETDDFYSYPRFSPSVSDEGVKVCWRAWDHPGLPFLDVKLYWANWRLDEGGRPLLENVEMVAGDGHQYVAELHWAPDGALFYTQEREGSDFRQLYCTYPRNDKAGEGEHFRLEGLESVEFGDASWFCGFQTFIFLSGTSMVAVYTDFGTSHLIHVHIPTRQWTHLDVGLHDMRMDPLAPSSESSFLVQGSGHTTPSALYSVKLAFGGGDGEAVVREKTQLAISTTKSFPEEVFSTPEHIQMQSKGEPVRPIHGFYWPPRNPRFRAPEGTLPPLIVNPHGGPTGYTTPGLNIMGAQFWTSRGYAFLAINYTGSSAHGRGYREKLFHGNWGVLDRDDVPELVDHLADRGRIDRARVGIEGGSAGGYNVLQSLVWHPRVFAGGICFCGVSDVKALGRDTHKLESRYMQLLVLEPGMSEEEADARFRERSPLFHAQRIEAPLLLVHGDKDTIVPIAQSEEIRDRVAAKGGDVRLVVLPGDGHMFKIVENLRLSMDEQVKWWEKTLLK